MTQRVVVASLILFLLFVVGLTCKNGPGDGEKIARSYCSTCHQFPEPGLLDKNTWLNEILPRMGSLAGITYYGGQPYIDVYALERKKDSLNPVNPGIVLDDWKKISDYYRINAPDSMPDQGRSPITVFTNLFITRRGGNEKGSVPSTSFVKIDPGNHWIYAARAWDSTLHIYNSQLKEVASAKLHGIIPDMNFSGSMLQSGARQGILTNIGIMNPNDFQTGSADSFFIGPDARLRYLESRIQQMPRPVQTVPADLNQDGKMDLLVCGFGNTKGLLYWMQNDGDGKYEKRIIRPLPGATKAIVQDFNNDGLPDIMALMSQAREGIYLFTNKGNGAFDSRPLLTFPPIYGSTFFDLVDFNKDGRQDIIYTCGDNADYSSDVLKNYHGLYIFINEGNNNYKQRYFFPMHGCYKALARDFDNDGDLDIAAISYYPDTKHQLEESFVYLENKGDYNFKPFGIRQFAEGKWLTMDAGDIDGDGDLDIVIGSLIPPVEAWRRNTASYKAGWPALLLLENQASNK